MRVVIRFLLPVTIGRIRIIHMKEKNTSPELLFFVGLIVMGLLMACLLLLGEDSSVWQRLF